MAAAAGRLADPITIVDAQRRELLRRGPSCVSLEESAPGRPRRHLYRLTPDGLASATAALAETEPSTAKVRPGGSPRRGHGVAAPVVP
jgi:hypothetical protein